MAKKEYCKYSALYDRGPVAVHSAFCFGGVAILDFCEGGDAVISAWSFGPGTGSSARKTPVKYDDEGRAYISRFGEKWYLSDFVKVGV